MNKILSGIVGIVAVFAVVGASAYALFFGQATITGFNITTGTANLLVSIGPLGPTDTINLGGQDFGPFVPGDTETSNFTLHNEGDVDLDIVSTLEEPESAAWETLKSVFWVAIVPEGQAIEEADWVTFEDWVDGIELGMIPSDDEQEYTISYKFVDDSGNNTAGLSLNDLTVVFTGTQATE